MRALQPAPLLATKKPPPSDYHSPFDFPAAIAAPPAYVATGSSSAAIAFGKHVYEGRLRLLTNVYQLHYKYGEDATGLGDFIRGCYFLLQVCAHYRLACVPSIGNHPIAALLHNALPSDHCADVERWYETNHKAELAAKTIVTTYQANGNSVVAEALFDYFAEQPIDALGNLRVYVTAYPLRPPSLPHRRLLQHLLTPSDALTKYVDTVCPQRKGGYHVVQLRGGDQGSAFAMDMELVAAEVSRIDAPFIVGIADSPALLSQLGCLQRVAHSGEAEVAHTASSTASSTALRNTMADFVIMSRAVAVWSFSCYTHGSGFSEWCATTYGVPFRCVYARKE
jgi:hypothetical protein